MDIEELQGLWWNGLATLAISGDRFTTGRMGAEYSGRVVLDETTTPKAITLHFENGPEKGDTNRK
jgi:hypothetical protein